MSLYQQQKADKPLIENQIQQCLTEDAQSTALDFVTWLKDSKIKPTWSLTNQWQSNCKGKTICIVCVDNGKWSIRLCLRNSNEYKDLAIENKLQEFVCDKMQRCTICNHKCNSGTNSGANVVILGKELENICYGAIYTGRNWVEFENPNADVVEKLKQLIVWEKQSRSKIGRSN